MSLKVEGAKIIPSLETDFYDEDAQIPPPLETVYTEGGKNMPMHYSYSTGSLSKNARAEGYSTIDMTDTTGKIDRSDRVDISSRIDKFDYDKDSRKNPSLRSPKSPKTPKSKKFHKSNMSIDIPPPPSSPPPPSYPAPRIPKSPKTPKSQMSPKSPKSPRTPKSLKSPSRKDSDNPNTPKSRSPIRSPSNPKTPKSPRSPRTPGGGNFESLRIKITPKTPNNREGSFERSDKKTQSNEGENYFIEQIYENEPNYEANEIKKRDGNYNNDIGIEIYDKKYTIDKKIPVQGKTEKTDEEAKKDYELLKKMDKKLASMKLDIEDLKQKKIRKYLKKKRCKCTCRSSTICAICLAIGFVFMYTLVSPYAHNSFDDFPTILDFILYVLYVSTLSYIAIYFVLAFVLCFLLYPTVKWCRNRRIKKLEPEFKPKVSVLIPAYNEEIGVMKTVHTVLASDYNNILEVIIINDGSTDKTHDIITEFLTEYEDEKIPIKYLNIPNGGKAKALNRGFELVSKECDIVFTIDSDSIMHKTCLSNIVRNFYDEQVGACAGVTVISNEGINARVISMIQQFEYLYGFFIKRGQSLLNLVWVVGGANAAYRKSVLTKIGGIPTGLMTEDIALTFAIICEGYKIKYDDSCVVFTEGPTSIKGLCKQRFRWTYGKYQTWIKYKEIFFSTKHCHNVLFSWIFLPLLVLNELMSSLLFPWVFPLGIWQIANVQSATYLSYLNAAFCAMVLLAIISDPVLRKYHLNLVILAPCSLIIVYLTSLVDMQSSLRTYWAFLSKKTPSWGKWTRKGVET